MGGQRGWKRRREYKKGENENDKRKIQCKYWMIFKGQTSGHERHC